MLLEESADIYPQEFDQLHARDEKQSKVCKVCGFATSSNNKCNLPTHTVDHTSLLFLSDSSISLSLFFAHSVSAVFQHIQQSGHAVTKEIHGGQGPSSAAAGGGTGRWVITEEMEKKKKGKKRRGV
jgi:hypothetical protein